MDDVAQFLLQVSYLVGTCSIILTVTAVLDSIHTVRHRSGRRYWGEHQKGASKPALSSTPRKGIHEEPD